MEPEHGRTVAAAIVSELLESARHAAARAVNSLITTTYWEIGRRIVEEEQQGRERAVYGDGSLKDCRMT